LKVFLSSVAALVIIAAASQFILTRFVGESSEQAYSTPSTRP